jgi:hypothetical protein
MTLKERKEAIKDYVKRNRDFAFFVAGATCTVLAEMVLLDHLNKPKKADKQDILVMDKDGNIIEI